MPGVWTQQQPLVIQVIGLPGSGKTTGITTVVKTIPDVTYLDIRDYPGVLRYGRLLKDIRNALSPVIVESACGIRDLRESEIIFVDVPFAVACARCENRDGQVDQDYMSLLQTQLIVPTKVTSPELLPSLLCELLRDINENCRDSC